MKRTAVYLAVMVLLAACGGGGNDSGDAAYIAPLDQPVQPHVARR